MERSPHDGGQNAALCGTAATHYALYMIGPQNQIETCIQKCIWPIFCDNWFIAAAIFSVTIGRQFLNMLPSPCIYRCIGGRFPISRLKCYPASVITLLPRQRTLLNVNDEYIGLSGGFQKLPASWNNFNDAVCSPPRLCKFSFWGTKSFCMSIISSAVCFGSTIFVKQHLPHHYICNIFQAPSYT